jgi:UDPglucose 6-dehydrogenase
MKIGFIGTGKLGLPVSLLYAHRGHDLYCYDVNPVFYREGVDPVDVLYDEELCPENRIRLKDWIRTQHFDSSRYRHTSVESIVANSDIIFVAVQTPHGKEYEGITRIPHERQDFDYTYLRAAMEELSAVADRLGRDITVIIISTVLPGTLRREILPTMSARISLCYNPYFIAMGTVAYDCLHPEFTLLGNHNPAAVDAVKAFYATIHSSPIHVTTLENAEMIKVCYNTFISTKIAMANTIMELCHSCPNTDCDDVVDALTMGTHRLISGAYLRGGMGDGGGCHPRDNIALSWLSNKIGMQFNWFDSIMVAREKQTDFLADLIVEEQRNSGLPVVILGTSFKPNTAIKTGSPAILLCNILTERGVAFTTYDPVSDGAAPAFAPAVYFVGCAHAAFQSVRVPAGSVLIDPHRKYSACLEAGKYIPVGRG